eukprot:GFYU01000236.1.p1 GENE.GFYU01000236.1~~GFYU01000236.1.p1  ORF type:complete len:318 (+),score=125.84 GFYU01000236.1:84-1037(+)
MPVTQSSTTSTVTLNNGLQMPILGLGTFLSKPGEVTNAVKVAIENGYRHIDGAACYQNEHEVGQGLVQGLKNVGINREDVWLTSKLWNTAHRKNEVEPALRKTLADLQQDYLDLYLIHWPVAFNVDPANPTELFPTDWNGNVLLAQVPLEETWAAMEAVLNKGLVKAIGVSNFTVQQLQHLEKFWNVVPAVNQVELTPYLPQSELVEYCQSKGIALTAYSPLGAPGLKVTKGEKTHQLLEESVVTGLATKYNKSPAQILIRFAIDRDSIVIPKSVTDSRIVSNQDVFDFQLTKEDVSALLSLEDEFRVIRPDWRKVF